MKTCLKADTNNKTVLIRQTQSTLHMSWNVLYGCTTLLEVMKKGFCSPCPGSVNNGNHTSLIILSVK